MLSIFGVLVSATQYWTNTNMLDEVKFLALLPKIFVLPAAAPKPKRKLFIPSDYEHTISEGSPDRPIILPKKKWQ